MTRALLVAGLALAALAGACSGGDATSDDASAVSGCFLAFDAQMAGFRGWTSFAFDGPAEGDAGIHVAGPRVEYVNRLPPAGSREFPVGTIIVKEVGASDPASHHLFAMAKRGCGYDAAGARGWEWMEIAETASGPTIVWRGLGPPAGEVYGGDPAGCNSCHAACSDNDSVCSSRLRLTGLQP